MSAKLVFIEVIIRNPKTKEDVVVSENINESDFDQFIDMAELLVKMRDAVRNLKRKRRDEVT